MHNKIPNFLKKAGTVFADAGFSVYLVGGAVRNIVSGLEPVDYDLATDASPEDVARLFRRVIPTGIKHGTVTVFLNNHAVEVTTFRIDGTYTNKRHPDSVSFTPSIKKDLERRDFTINSLALNLNTQELLDPHQGREDLKKGIIRAIGDPKERFSEDGLRLLRACRFSAQLDFTVEPHTREGMLGAHRNISSVSVERIRSELEKILATGKPSKAFHIMKETRIMEIVLPELIAGQGIGSKGPQGYDVLTHSLLACDGAPADNLPVRLAALLHDVGKPAVRDVHPQEGETFYKHEIVSEKIARQILRRYRFPRAMENHVCRLILHHMFNYTPDWSDAAVRRFLHRVGCANVKDLILLRRADHFGTTGHYSHDTSLNEFLRRIDTVMQSNNALGISDLAVNGNILHSEAGIPKGPVMGKVLNLLLDTVLDDPGQNTREDLVRIAGRLHDSIKGRV